MIERPSEDALESADTVLAWLAQNHLDSETLYATSRVRHALDKLIRDEASTHTGCNESWTLDRRSN